MSSFELDVSAITKKFKNRIDVVLKKVTFDLGVSIIILSPVDEGRFRDNWQIGINNDPDSVLEKIRGRDATIKALESEIKKVKGGDEIFFVNNLSYAEKLEEGWSPQAEAGVVGGTIAGYENTLDKIGIKVKNGEEEF